MTILPNKKSFSIAIIFSFAFWLFLLWLRSTDNFLIWDDQKVVFLRGAGYITHPYDIPGFFNPPWTLFILYPFQFLPFELGILAQILAYFIVLSFVVHKFGGDTLTVAVVLASPFALDSLINLNMEWIVCIGLVVPPALSAPFLTAKPQVALGYIMSFKPKEIVLWIGFCLVLMAITFLLYGNWIPDVLASMQHYKVGFKLNVGPQAFLPFWLCVTIGIVIGIYAFRKQDGVIAILAGTFFIPYIATYTLLPIFAVVAARWKRFAIVVSISLWIAVFVMGVSLV